MTMIRDIFAVIGMIAVGSLIGILMLHQLGVIYFNHGLSTATTVTTVAPTASYPEPSPPRKFCLKFNNQTICEDDSK